MSLRSTLRFVTPACVAVLLTAVVASAQEESHKIDSTLLAGWTSNADAPAPFFVLLKDRAELAAASRIPDRAARGKAVVQALQATAAASQAGLRGYLQSQAVPFVPYWVQNVIFVRAGNLGLARALAQRPEVSAIVSEPVFAVPEARPDKGGGGSGSGVEWNITKIRADQVWPATKGAGIVVASIDTGVRYTHTALVNQYRGNLAGTFSHAGNWKDPTGVCGGAPCDNTDHGTHVTGTMVGDDGVSNQIGVAPGAKWIACKGCTNNSACYGSHLMTCAQWIMDPLENGTGNNQPDIVNNSWSGARGDAWFLDFVDNWRAAGILPAFAVGNNGPYCATAASPGDYPAAFAAGATDQNDVIDSSSGRGPSSFAGIKPNVTAPGAWIRSSIATGDTSYATFTGTSMASPHVSGTVALIWAAQPGLRGKVALTEQLLRDEAVGIATVENCGGAANQIPNNTYGHGRIDALAAATATVAPNEPPVSTITSPAPGSAYKCPQGGSVNVIFAGQADDPENGDITSYISWYDNGAGFGALGGSASKSYVCTSDAGSHNVTASATDSGGLTDTDTITIQIQLCRPRGSSCTSNSQCCSNSCGGKKGATVCR